MKTKKWAIIFLLFTGIILFAAQTALGGCEVSDLDWLISGEKAPGSKLEGPLTIFYQCTELVPLDCADYEFSADMYFFLRLKKGSKLYSFAGGPEQINVPEDLTPPDPNSVSPVAVIIGEFFDDVVIPALYPGCDDGITSTCPNVVLKSVDKSVDWEPWDPEVNNNNGLAFFITDIVVGIRE